MEHKFAVSFLQKRSNNAFTLIEVVLALALISMLAIALTMLLRSSFDIREGLSQTAKVNHRLAAAMSKISLDLEHAYIISEQDLARYGDISKRKIKSVFQIEVGSNGDELRMTTMSHVPLQMNSNESDTTYVVYKLEEDKDTRRMNLMRGESKRVPEDFKELPSLKILARDIKTFKLKAWRGDEWSKDRWDTTRRDWRGLLPPMVMVDIESYLDEASEGGGSSRILSSDDEPSLRYTSVIYLSNSFGMATLKEGTVSIRWDKL